MRYSGPLRSGRQIAAARGLARMTQAALAEAGRWNVRSVRRWERADGLPTSHEPHLSALIDIFARAGVRVTAAPLGVIVSEAAQILAIKRHDQLRPTDQKSARDKQAN